MSEDNVSYWQPAFAGWRAELNDEQTRSLVASLGERGLAYGQSSDRTQAAGYYALLTTQPAQRANLAYAAAHMILWMYGIDLLLDTCTSMAPAEDLLRVVTLATSNPEAELTAESLAALDLQTDPTMVNPGAGCSILTLGQGAQQLVSEVAAHYGSLAAGPLFVREFNLQVAAEVMESRWRFDARWHGYSLDQYLELGAASIAAIHYASLLAVPYPRLAEEWGVLRSLVWLSAAVCRLANDVATVERDREEGRANALFVAAPDEEAARELVLAKIVELVATMESRLADLAADPQYDYFAEMLRRVTGTTLVLYDAGDFVIPGA